MKLLSKKLFYTLCFFTVTILIFSMQIYASPGGQIVEAAAKSWPGRILMALLFMILLPLIIYIYGKKIIAIKKTKKLLIKLANVNNNFRWTIFKERAYEVITQVYSAWKKSDVEQASEWMTNWYWRNQKITVLDQWENDGLRNICKLNKINDIRPLHIEYNEREPGDGEGSRLSVLLDVNLVDYLIDVRTNEIVEGDIENKNSENIWTFVLEEGKWKLTLIEDSLLALQYAKMEKDIETASEYIRTGYKYKKNKDEEKANPSM